MLFAGPTFSAAVLRGLWRPSYKTMMVVKLYFAARLIEKKVRIHIRDAFQSLSSFRSQCYISVNWITSKNHTGVNITLSRATIRVAIEDIKAPPAFPSSA